MHQTPEDEPHTTFIAEQKLAHSRALGQRIDEMMWRVNYDVMANWHQTDRLCHRVDQRAKPHTLLLHGYASNSRS